MTVDGQEDRRLVMVEWTDAGCDASWQTHGSLLTPSKCMTVGWLMHEDTEFLLVAATVSIASGDFNQSMSIPTGMVVSIKDISSD